MNSEYFQRRDRHAGPLPIYRRIAAMQLYVFLVSLVDQISTMMYSTCLSKRPAAAVWIICEATKVTKVHVTCRPTCLIVSTECTGAPAPNAPLAFLRPHQTPRSLGPADPPSNLLQCEASVRRFGKGANHLRQL